jgi:hypothetical protein
MSSKRVHRGGVTAPSGFRASGLHCGIKASGKPDLSLIVSDTPASAAGVFTVNLAKAAPCYLCQDHLASSHGLRTRSSPTAAAPTRAPARRETRREGNGAADRQARRLSRGSRAGRVDRRDRRQPEDGQDPRGVPQAVAALAPTAAPPRRARS